MNSLVSRGLRWLAASLLIASSNVGFAQSVNIDALVPIISFLLDEKCHSGQEVISQTIVDQAGVDALEGVSKINGNLILASSTDDLDLTPLANLKSVTGMFALGSNTAQTAISGFDCLTSVGSLSFDSAPNLETVSGFSALQSITTGRLNFRSNPKLTLVAGFERLNDIATDLNVVGNAELLNISNFQSLKTVGGYIQISINAKLTELLGFDSLLSVSRSLIIGGNTDLSFISAFPLLTTVGEGFQIAVNANLTSIAGFSKLFSVSGGFAVANNAELVVLAQFPELQTVDRYFFIKANPKLDLSGGTPASWFTTLNSVGGNLDISENSLLSVLPGFNALQTISGNLEINQNAALTNINGFNALQSLAARVPPPPPADPDNYSQGNLLIGDNASVTSITGFNQLSSIHGFSIVSHPALTAMGQFPALASMSGSFQILNNGTNPGAQFDIGGFNALQSVPGVFQISQNAGLREIVGFNLLASINSFLARFKSNPLLHTIFGFVKLNMIGGNLDISDNAVIETIGGFNLLDNTDITGDSYIVGNKNLNCPNMSMPYLPPDVSTGNLVNCVTNSLSASNPLMPVANGVNVAQDADISVSMTGSTASINPSIANFIVHGGGTGKQTGNYSNSGNTLSFDPNLDFFPGEKVSVILTQETGISPHVFQFTSAVSDTGAHGQFVDQANAIGAENSEGVAIGDINGDGHLDVFFANNGQANRVYTSVGSSVSFAGAMNSASTGVALGDIDGDGDLDAFVTHRGQANQVLNYDTGVFSLVTPPVAFNARNSEAVEFGDFNGDGALDAFVANYNQANQLYVNTPNGFSPLDISNQSLNSVDVKVGDLDNDGDLDAFVANDGQANTVYLNSGNLISFAFTQSALGSPNPSTAADLGDIDGDGDLDIFIVNNGQTPDVYRNDGNANFSYISQSNSSFNQIGNNPDVKLGDFDADGDLDAYVTNYGSPNIIFENNGSGQFSLLTQAVNQPSSHSKAVALGDLDGDGDLDAAIANTNSAANIIGTNTVPSAKIVAYGWASDQSSTSNYTLDPRYSFSTSAGSIQSRRTGEGAYEITFSGMNFSSKTNFQVSVYDFAASADEICRATSVSGATIRIKCSEPRFGDAENVRFVVAAVEETYENSEANVVAYAYVPSASSNGTYSIGTASYNSYNSVAVMTATRSAVGQYTVNFPSGSIRTGDKSAVLATSRGSNRYCNVKTWGDDSAQIYCFAASGSSGTVAADASFYVTVISTDPSAARILGYGSSDSNGSTNQSDNYNITGGNVNTTFTSSGVYRYSFVGIIEDSGLNIQLTTAGNDHIRCTVGTPTTSYIPVNCKDQIGSFNGASSMFIVK